MGIQAVTEQVMTRSLKPIEKQAAKKSAMPAKALMALDSASLGQLNRSAVKEIAQFNADALAKYPDLLKLKYQRMSVTPFTFFRGTDHLFYHDMARAEGKAMDKGPKTVLQGDMHMSNFGTMVRPDGKVFLDLNDFDEAYVGPANLDLKRFGTSVVLAAQQAGFQPEQARQFVREFASSYHDTLQRLVDHPMSVEELKPATSVQNLVDQSSQIETSKWVDLKTTGTDGDRRFKRSKTISSVSDRTAADLKEAFERYRATLPKATADEFSTYHVSDVVSAVAGTGSVGRARFRLLLEAEKQDPVVMEVKEEVPSAIAPYVSTPNPFKAEADRFVVASRVMDGKLDPYMGTTTLPMRDALQSKSFLVRRVFPTKAAIDPTTVKDEAQFSDLVKYYAQEVAIGHANGSKLGLSDAAGMLAGIGDQTSFSDELVNFSQRYAQQVNRDYQAFKAALNQDPLLKK